MKYTIDEIQNEMMPIIMQYNIPKVYIFGSYAKQEASEDSDVDLVIDSCNISGLWELIRFKQDVSSVLGKQVDVLTLRSIESEKDNPLKKDFINHFMIERICIYEQRS